MSSDEASIPEQVFADLDSDDDPDSITRGPPPTKSLDEALEIKTLGNNLFKEGNYAGALNEYEEALRHCPSTEDLNMSHLYNNMAACHLKLDEYEHAVEACTDSLRHQPRSEKALYRRAKANEALATSSSLAAALKDYRVITDLPDVSSDTHSFCTRQVTTLPARISRTQEEEKDKLLDDFQTQQDPTTGATSVNLRSKPGSK
ncbi:hypothetical protein H4R33_000595 [Dimargaris cristalligena]|nr:hypothetical protein H4R33_000595 [Dimargaris cristalligena]